MHQLTADGASCLVANAISVTFHHVQKQCWCIHVYAHYSAAVESCIISTQKQHEAFLSALIYLCDKTAN